MTINDAQTWSFIKELPLLATVKDLVWIGLRYDENKSFQWTSGETYSDFKSKHWAAGQPITRDKYDCTNLKLRDATGSLDRRNAAWSMDRCNRPFPFLCEVSADEEFGCLPGWEDGIDYCYKMPDEKLRIGFLFKCKDNDHQ